MMPNGDRNYLTINEAEAEFGINPNALAFAIRQGRVQAVKRGHAWFIPRAEIARYLDKYKHRVSHLGDIVEGAELAQWLQRTARGRRLASRAIRAHRDKKDVQIVALRWDEHKQPVVLVQGTAAAGSRVEAWIRMPTHKIEMLTNWREIQPIPGSAAQP